MAAFEIYALCYAGPLEGSTAITLWNRDWDVRMQRAYYIWCLLGPGGPVVVDAGVEPVQAKERALPGYVNPAELLARLGVDAAKVPHLVLTHLHWDHVGGVGLFPAAQLHVQEAEWHFWHEDPVARRSAFKLLRDDPGLAIMEQAQAQGRLKLHQGDATLLPGLELISAPGHTPGLMAVKAATAAGPAVLGSDCGPTFRNFAEDWPSVFICDLPAWLRSLQRLRGLVQRLELLFPGHDMALSKNYPQVAPGVTRLV